jgi:hypothetical protein
MAVAGSITVTTSDLGGGYSKYSIAWVSSAGGAVAENAVTIKRGHIHLAKFIPDGGGTQPTDLYDVTLIDAIAGATGADYLAGTGVDVSNAARKISAPQIGNGTATQPVFWEGGDLYPTVANAGNAKGGTIVLVVGP